MYQGSRGFELRLHVGEHPLYSLELANRLAECAALFGVRDGSFERSLRDSNGLRRDAYAASI
jgi:hypothetical protein